MATKAPAPWEVVGKVRSATQPGKVYLIRFRADRRELSCECMAFRFTKAGPDGQKPPCRHLILLAESRLFLVTE
jgi:hypothetical protein